MKHLIKFLLFISFIGLCLGFYIKDENTVSGDYLIGLSLMLLMFIIMPLFIYNRWKNKDIKDYMLTEESIKKMRAFNNSKDNLNT
jgi:flagellar biosynthesis protein FliP|tara:strand:+ start:148 stop:402 length:255 start_codon:yes stop_codon:yes gene_type:complete